MADLNYEAIRKALKDFKPTPEWIEEQRRFDAEMQEYMKLPKHPGNCHCYRCMEEFSEYLKNKERE